MKQVKCELFCDNFQNYKRYGIPKAQLVIADIPYNIGADAYDSYGFELDKQFYRLAKDEMLKEPETVQIGMEGVV